MRSSLPITLLFSFLGIAACDGASGGAGGAGGAPTSKTTTTGSNSASTGVSTADATSASTADASSGAGGGGACVSGHVQATAECTACQDASCCLTATAAATDPGTWTRSGAKICREANCAAECGVSEPECGGIVPSPASCVDELYASCCAEVTACAKSDACTALIYICIDDRGHAPGSLGFITCAREFPGGDALFADLDTCFAGVTCS